MPGREIPLVSHEIYHVFNRGIARQPVFYNRKDYQRFLETMYYYQYQQQPVRYSKFLALSVEERRKAIDHVFAKKACRVDFISYCLMPNHFHILLQQKADNGTSRFIADLSNSYTRFFNTKSNREGPLFQGKFKAVHIEDDNQLLHVTRYIHLNPYTSCLVKTAEESISYPYSSLAEYLGENKADTVSKEMVLGQFRTKESFKKFTFDQADYQRRLADIKHLVLDK